jgi:hypothetical protein
VISEILGVPYEDHDLLQRNALIGVGRDATPKEIGESASPWVAIWLSSSALGPTIHGTTWSPIWRNG